MESAMPSEERTTHRNLALWMQDRAKELNIKQGDDDENDADEEEDAKIAQMLEGSTGAKDDDSDEEEAKPDPKAKAKAKAAPEKEEEDQGTIDKQKNWSAVNVAYKE